jgi:hypothetical protein|tara:strand:+ start:460 stop:624 length:165 start_codon:yes stop_codon:yes gene_type:complete
MFSPICYWKSENPFLAFQGTPKQEKERLGFQQIVENNGLADNMATNWCVLISFT